MRAFFIAFAAATASIVVFHLLVERYHHGNDIIDVRRWASLLIVAPVVALVPGVSGGVCAKLHDVVPGILGLIAGPIAWYVVGA